MRSSSQGRRPGIREESSDQLKAWKIKGQRQRREAETEREKDAALQGSLCSRSTVNGQQSQLTVIMSEWITGGADVKETANLHWEMTR